MSNRTGLILCVCILILYAGGEVSGQQKTSAGTVANQLSDRERDGLVGPVRRMTVESAKITFKNGSATEEPRVLREITTYDPRGKKVDNVAYPVGGETLPGKEQYEYDDKGNIVAMQLRGSDGRLLSKEVYKYELDQVGNWRKMTTSLAVFQDGKVSHEPVEVTYRTITYFYSQEIAKIVAAAPANGSTTARANLNEAGGSKAPTKSEPQFTSLVETNNTSIRADSSKSFADSKPFLMSGEATPVSQKLSSTNLTVPTSDVQISPAPAPPLTNEASSGKELKLSDERASGVAVSNSAPTGALSAKTSDSPDTASASDPISLYKRGLSYLESGKPAEAVQVLKQTVHKDPENALAYVKLGLAYSSLQQHKEAIAVFKLAIQIRRALVDAEAYYHLGQAYTGLGKHSDAVKALKQALYITRAEVMNSEGQPSQKVPSAAEIHYSLGLAYHQLTKYTDAVKELQKVIEVNPGLAEAYYGLAVCYILLGDRKSAEKQQKVLADLNPVLAQKVADALSQNRIIPHGITEGILGRR